MLKASSFRQSAQQYESDRAARSEAEIVCANLDCMRFHCEAFGIARELRQSAAYTGFEEIVRTAGRGVVESSVKVSGGAMHPARFNLLYAPADKLSFLQSMFAFVEKVAAAEPAALNLQPVRQMLEGADLSCVTRMVCGIDLRTPRLNSRLKIWVFADHDPRRPNGPVARVLRSLRADARFHALHSHPALLLGYDLRFDGATAWKIYPDLWEQELQAPGMQSRLSGVLSGDAMRLMREAYWTHIYLAEGQKEMQLDLHLKSPDEFVARWLRNETAARIHAAYRDVPMLDVVAAIPESHASREAAEDFTLYYMPARIQRSWKTG